MAKNKTNTKKRILDNHQLMMVVCCLVLIVGFFFLKGENTSWFWILILLCPLMHIFMMKDHKKGKKCH